MSSKGYEIRARNIAQITEQYYEKGRADRCLKQVWRRHIFPKFGIGYRAYLRYVKFCDGQG
ncbi:hypothetical protein BN938_1465 [Mucinivorans hirudinis]|uniref:Uncharacterized protein n=1 Tax=Mucinivorans hirudinis TaxID=1433126 RepID=A0A060R859_9BACT|nr:hypothetical protein BN938_1465 [Mucinivorans hirudinis]